MKNWKCLDCGHEWATGDIEDTPPCPNCGANMTKGETCEDCQRDFDLRKLIHHEDADVYVDIVMRSVEPLTHAKFVGLLGLLYEELKANYEG